MVPAVIDVEASGFGRGSYPIEVGFILPDQSSSCYIIRPYEEWTHWSRTAEAAHGISRKILREHGSPPDEVACCLNDRLAGMTVYSDAWANDVSWLGKLFEWVGIPQLFHIESLRCLLSEEQAALWHPIKEEVMAGLDLSRHRASSDARILQETFCLVRERAEG